MKNVVTTVLISTLGRNPQVLVETVWALANPKEPIKPIIPDKVIAVSMANYASEAKKKLLGEGGGWELLLGQLRETNARIAGRLKFNVEVVADERGEVCDLRTDQDNMRCADYLFRLIRQHMGSSVRIILSLSGGRKSLSALATTIMSLLARPEDRLVHLIADSKLEDGEYHFPQGADGYSLFEVPFIRTRGLLKGIDASRALSFEECLRLAQGKMPSEDEFPVLSLDMTNGTLSNGISTVRGIDPTRFVLLWLVFRQKRLARDIFRQMLEDAVKDAKARRGADVPVWFRNLANKGGLPEFRQVLALTRQKVLGEGLGLSQLCCLALLPKGDGRNDVFEIEYPSGKLRIQETEFSTGLYDRLTAQA